MLYFLIYEFAACLLWVLENDCGIIVVRWLTDISKLMYHIIDISEKSEIVKKNVSMRRILKMASITPILYSSPIFHRFFYIFIIFMIPIFCCAFQWNKLWLEAKRDNNTKENHFNYGFFSYIMSFEGFFFSIYFFLFFRIFPFVFYDYRWFISYLVKIYCEHSTIYRTNKWNMWAILMRRQDTSINWLRDDLRLCKPIHSD